MLDRLPFELLNLILDHLREPPHRYRSSKVREEALLAFCLVSKDLRAWAQPQLGREVHLVEWHKIERIEAVIEDECRADIRRRAKVFSSFSPIRCQRICDLLRRFESLEEVQLEGFWPSESTTMDLSTLQSLPALRVLHLEGLKIESFPPAFILPCLEQLSLGMFTINVEHASAFLSTATLPALKALSLGIITTHLSRRSFFPTLSPAFVQQLDMTQSCCEISDIPPSLLSCTIPFLFQADFELDDPAAGVLSEMISHAPRHVGLASPDASEYGLDKLVDLVRSRSKPVSIHLPSSSRTPGAFPDPFFSFALLLQACEEEKIHLVWHLDVENSLTVSQEFWAYAREFKATARAEGGEGEARSDGLE